MLCYFLIILVPMVVPGGWIFWWMGVLLFWELEGASTPSHVWGSVEARVAGRKGILPSHGEES